jgi:hypothetical protein
MSTSESETNTRRIFLETKSAQKERIYRGKKMKIKLYQALGHLKTAASVCIHSKLCPRI